jgi:glycogen operon protein
VRDFWRGLGNVGEFAQRFTGSSDLYGEDGRDPFASINFVTAHDGFTLHDLVSYNHKHNEANGEDSGESNNRSWNCGAEGPTDDPLVNELRARQARNFLTTLLLSQGVPMLLGGDELGRTQQGNNNAYCQDNEISWYDWAHVDHALLAFTTRLIALRREHPVFRRRNWFAGHPIGQHHADNLPDVAWFAPDGTEMEEEQWCEEQAKALAVFLNGSAIAYRDRRGEPVIDESFLMCFNAHYEDLVFTLPDTSWGDTWQVEIDTAQTHEATSGDPALERAGAALKVAARSVVVLRRLEAASAG